MIRRIERPGPDPNKTRNLATTAIIIGGVIIITGVILVDVMVKGTIEIIDDIASICTDY